MRKGGDWERRVSMQIVKGVGFSGEKKGRKK